MSSPALSVVSAASAPGGTSADWSEFASTDSPASTLTGAALAAVDDSLYLFGGRRIADGQRTADLWTYSLATGHWWLALEAPDRRPEPRDGHTLVAMRGLLLLTGGLSTPADSVAAPSALQPDAASGGR